MLTYVCGDPFPSGSSPSNISLTNRTFQYRSITESNSSSHDFDGDSDCPGVQSAMMLSRQCSHSSRSDNSSNNSSNSSNNSNNQSVELVRNRSYSDMQVDMMANGTRKKDSHVRDSQRLSQNDQRVVVGVQSYQNQW